MACSIITRHASFAALLIVACLPFTANAQPEPALVSESWELEFRYDDPKIIRVRVPGETRPKLYWYIKYSVANNTGAERLFIPDVLVYTDKGDLQIAGKGVLPEVFESIRDYLRNPLLESPITVVGQLRQGQDNARDSVFIWPVPKHDVDSYRIFIGGLSGETHVVLDPKTEKRYLLRKTLMVDYKTPGDSSHAENKPVRKQKEVWILR